MANIIYDLTVTANPALRARAIPNGSPSVADFFKKGDVLTADNKVFSGAMDWYRITKCVRAGQIITLPYTVNTPPYTETYAGAGNVSLGEYLHVDGTHEDGPPVEPPVGEVASSLTVIYHYPSANDITKNYNLEA